MSKHSVDCELNPLASVLGDMVHDIWVDIHETSEMLELCRPCGIAHEDVGASRWRPATNEESCIGTGELVAPKLAIDLRKPVPNQVTKWLRRIARDLNASADSVELIEDGRDLKAIRKLVKGPQNVIV